MNAARPFAGTRLPTFLTKRVLELKPKKTQAEIAIETGFVNPNMLAMIKGGSSRLPLDRVSALAKALDVDPAHLLLLALEQMIGSTEAQAIVTTLSTAVTSNEMGWIHALREASGHSNPPLTRRGRAAIFSIWGK